MKQNHCIFIKDNKQCRKRAFFPLIYKTYCINHWKECLKK